MSKSLFENEVKKKFEQYYLGLVEFSWRIIRCEESSRDIVQDVFVKILEADSPLAAEDERVKSYLYAMVKNASLNYLRRRKVVDQYNQYAILQLDNVEETVLDAMIYAERLNQLHLAIETLPTACQNICNLTFIEEKTNMDVAKLTNTSVNTVKTHKKRAVELLRKRLVATLKTTKALLF